MPLFLIFMEKRKEEEIKYYDNNIKEYKENRDFEGFDPFLLSSLNFLKNTFIKNYRDKNVLDFGCGNGIHSVWIENYSKKVIGIDLSQKSLEIAKKRTKKTDFILMDCEKLEFENNSFDIVFDGGTFSSIDLNISIKEIIRVLNKDGVLIGIETLGHNPVMNLKRKLNKLRGKRTSWAEAHIFKIKDFYNIKEYFEESEIYFFHLFSFVAFPLLKFKWGIVLLKFLEKTEIVFLRAFPFLKRYSFKVVFVFKNPIK